MKNTFNLLSIGLTFGLLIFTGCVSDDSDEATISPINDANVMRASIGSFSFESDDLNTGSSLSGMSGAQTLRLTAGDGSRIITLEIIGYAGEGTYDVSTTVPERRVVASYAASNGSSNINDWPVWNAPFENSTNGQVVINAASASSVSGSFNFVGQNGDETLAVSNGTFIIEL